MHGGDLTSNNANLSVLSKMRPSIVSDLSLMCSIKGTSDGKEGRARSPRYIRQDYEERVGKLPVECKESGCASRLLPSGIVSPGSL